jgi:hypothetical protein
MITTIQLDNNLKQKLENLKIHPRESYNDLIARLIENCSLGNLEKEGFAETFEILSDPETMRNLANSLEKINNLEDKNNWISWEKIKKELKLNV